MFKQHNVNVMLLSQSRSPMRRPLWFVEWPQVADTWRWQAYNFDNGCKRVNYVRTVL